MTPARPQHDGLVARTIEEALESVTTSHTRASLLEAALDAAGISSIPERGPEVLDFAEGPLKDALAARIGPDVADEVLSQVRPVLLRASLRPSRSTPREGVSARPLKPSPPPFAEVRPTRPTKDRGDDEDSGVYISRPPPGTPIQGGDSGGHAARGASGQGASATKGASGQGANTAPLPSKALPTIYLASRDGDAAIRLAIALGGRATVRVVEGLLDLVDALDEDQDGGARVVVVDGSRPSVQLPSLVTVAPDLAGRASVLVWRASRADLASLDGSSGARDWTRCPRETVEQLAALCLVYGV